MKGVTPSDAAAPTSAEQPSASSANNANDGTANAAELAVVGRPTPSPTELPESSAEKSNSPPSSGKSSSPPTDGESQGREKQQYSIAAPDCKQDTASSKSGGSPDDSKVEEEATTPDPIKKQLAALAADNALTRRQAKQHPNNDARKKKTKKAKKAKKSAAAAKDDTPLSTSPVGSLGLGPLLGTPDEQALLGELQSDHFGAAADANISDFELLGREVMAAASTATAMMSRYEGFDSGMLWPTSAPAGGGGLDAMNQFFPMPAAATSGGGGGGANTAKTYFQVTAYRQSQRNGRTPGTTPPAVTSAGRSSEDNALLQSRERPRLPLRKRKVEENVGNDESKTPAAAEESKPSAAEEARKAVAAVNVPAGNKKRRELVRHNMRNRKGNEDGSADRTICKCKKSKW